MKNKAAEAILERIRRGEGTTFDVNYLVSYWKSLEAGMKGEYYEEPKICAKGYCAYAGDGADCAFFVPKG